MIILFALEIGGKEMIKTFAIENGETKMKSPISLKIEEISR